MTETPASQIEIGKWYEVVLDRYASQFGVFVTTQLWKTDKPTSRVKILGKSSNRIFFRHLTTGKNDSLNETSVAVLYHFIKVPPFDQILYDNMIKFNWTKPLRLPKRLKPNRNFRLNRKKNTLLVCVDKIRPGL